MLLQAPHCRALRKAFAPIHKAMSVREAGTLEYARQRQLRKEQQALLGAVLLGAVLLGAVLLGVVRY